MDDSLDPIFKALADPTRRAILDMLRDGPRRTTDIVEVFPRMTRFGVIRHLDVLKSCGLVVSRREGREVHNRLNAVPLRRVYERWVTKFEDLWADRLLRVIELAESPDPTDPIDPTDPTDPDTPGDAGGDDA